MDRRNLACGGWLLLEGYFRKIVIADSLAGYVDRVYASAEGATGPQIVLATVLFGLQIFGDFSGYTCIARGCGKLLGVELSENFDKPYFASSIRDFWRRWHMTLTRWFRDYVYIPLGGSQRGLCRQVGNTLFVFLLSGIWHGAGWNFVLWGGIHGLYLAAGILWNRRAGKAKEEKGGRIKKLLRQLRTFALVSFAWLFFRAESLAKAGLMLRQLCTDWGRLPCSFQEGFRFLALILCLFLLEGFSDRREAMTEKGRVILAFFLLFAIALGWLMALEGQGTNAFIYFQF